MKVVASFCIDILRGNSREKVICIKSARLVHYITLDKKSKMLLRIASYNAVGNFSSNHHQVTEHKASSSRLSSTRGLKILFF